jgi:hypothetical protein
MLNDESLRTYGASLESIAASQSSLAASLLNFLGCGEESKPDLDSDERGEGGHAEGCHEDCDDLECFCACHDDDGGGRLYSREFNS